MASIASGSQGPQVAQVQQALIQQGFLTGPADGVFGPETLGAVIAFQKSKGLAADGLVGPQTWAALFPDGPAFPLDGGLNSFAKGIDVSHYQGTVNWGGVRKAGIMFTFIKATEGTALTDETFQANWQGALAAGVRRGAYHFYRPQYTGVSQAEYFLQTLGSLQNGDLPPVLDAEEIPAGTGQVPWSTDSSANAAQIQDFLTAVEKGLGVQPMIYSTASFFQDVMGSTTQFGGYPLWVAKYPTDNPVSLQDPVPPYPPTILPSGWTSWNFWQYTQNGTIPGLFDSNQPVDLDLFNGTPVQFQKF